MGRKRDNEVPGMDYYLALPGVVDSPYNRTVYRHLAAMTTELMQNGYEVGIAFLWLPEAMTYCPFICYEMDDSLAPVVAGTTFELLRDVLKPRCSPGEHDCEILYQPEPGATPYQEAAMEMAEMEALQKIADELGTDDVFTKLDDLFVEGGDDDDG